MMTLHKQRIRFIAFPCKNVSGWLDLKCHQLCQGEHHLPDNKLKVHKFSGVYLLLMLHTLLLQGFGDGGDILQSFQELNAGLSTLQQEHTLPVGLLLLHQHLQGGTEKEEEEEEQENREWEGGKKESS